MEPLTGYTSDIVVCLDGVGEEEGSIATAEVSTTETTITVNLELSETGTAWCQAVRHGFNASWRMGRTAESVD